MNEQLSNALVNLITQVTSGAEEAGKFLITETPEVVRQILTWYLAESVIYCLVGVVMFILSWKVYKHISIKPEEDESNYYWETPKDPDLPFVVVVCTLIMVNTFQFMLWDLTWLKIWIAPKLWLIEYAAVLAGKM